MINKFRKLISNRMQIVEVTDPVFEIQRILRISGIKIKNIDYDIKGNAEIELAKKSDLEEALKILKDVKTLSKKVSISIDNNKLNIQL